MTGSGRVTCGNEGILRTPWIEDVVYQVISRTEYVWCDKENFRWKVDVSDRALHSRVLDNVRLDERRVVLSDGRYSIQSQLSRLCITNLDPSDLGYTFARLGGAIVVPVDFFIHVRRNAKDFFVELYINHLRIWGYEGPKRIYETLKPIGQSKKLTKKMQSLGIGNIKQILLGVPVQPLSVDLPKDHPQRPFTASRFARNALKRFNDRHATQQRNTEPTRTVDDSKKVRGGGSMGSDTESEEDRPGLKPLAIVNSGPERSAADKVADQRAPDSSRIHQDFQVRRRGWDPRRKPRQTSQDASSDARTHRGETQEARDEQTGLEDARQEPHSATPSPDDVESCRTPPTRDGERRKLRSSAPAQPSMEVPVQPESEPGGVETRSRRRLRVKGTGKFSVRFEVDGERAETSRSTEESALGSAERLTQALRGADNRELDSLPQQEPSAADCDVTEKPKPISSTENGHDAESTLSTPSIEKAKPIDSTETGQEAEAMPSTPAIQHQNPATHEMQHEAGIEGEAMPTQVSQRPDHEMQHEADIEGEALPTQVSQRLAGARFSGKAEAAARTQDGVDGPCQEKVPASSHPGAGATELAGSVAYGPDLATAATEVALAAAPGAQQPLAKTGQVIIGPGRQPVGAMPDVHTPVGMVDDAALLEPDKHAMNDCAALEDEIPDSAEQDRPERSDRGTQEEEVDIPDSFPELEPGNGVERAGPRAPDSDASTQAPLDKPRAHPVQTEENVPVEIAARVGLGSPEAGRETAENSRLARADNEEAPQSIRFVGCLERAEGLAEPSPIVELGAELRPTEARARRDLNRSEKPTRASHNGPSTRTPKAGGDVVKLHPDKSSAHSAGLRRSRRLEKDHGSVNSKPDYRDNGRFRSASNRASHSERVGPDRDEISPLPGKPRGSRAPATGYADYGGKGGFRSSSNHASHSERIGPDPHEISALPERPRGPRAQSTGYGSTHRNDDNHETDRFSVPLTRASNSLAEPYQFGGNFKSLSRDVEEHVEARFSLRLNRAEERMRRDSLAASPLTPRVASNKRTAFDTETISHAPEGGRRASQSGDSGGVGLQTKRGLEAALAAYSAAKRRRRGGRSPSRDSRDRARAVHEDNDSKFSSHLLRASKKRQQCIIM